MPGEIEGRFVQARTFDFPAFMDGLWRPPNLAEIIAAGEILCDANDLFEAVALRFEDAAADVVLDYQINGKRSLKVLKRRITKHLAPFFGGRRMSVITTANVRAFVAHRQAQTIIVRRAHGVTLKSGKTIEIPTVTRTPSNAEINRELATLKRMFSLAIQAGKLIVKPHIPLLHDNVRTGFFEPEQYQAVLARLPTHLRPVIAFAYVTGWRIPSEVLTLE